MAAAAAAVVTLASSLMAGVCLASNTSTAPSPSTPARAAAAQALAARSPPTSRRSSARSPRSAFAVAAFASGVGPPRCDDRPRDATAAYSAYSSPLSSSPLPPPPPLSSPSSLFSATTSLQRTQRRHRPGAMSALGAAPSPPTPAAGGGSSRISSSSSSSPPPPSSSLLQRRDALSVAGHLLGCLGAAAALSTYEDYDCSNLKPQRASLRDYYGASSTGSAGTTTVVGSATRGMGWGESDREARRYGERYGEQAGRDIPSYNEVMLRHRTERVPRWRAERRVGAAASGEEGSASATLTTTAIGTASDVTDSVGCVYDALGAVSTLKSMADDYQWDTMDDLLGGPILTSDLEVALSTLRSADAHLTPDARQTVGFDWGSCAWRHCGAAADAQESLAELRNSLGLFEPFECMFVLDIVERSLRDVLAVVPPKLHPEGKDLGSLGPYVPYRSRGGDSDGYAGDDDDGMTIDLDFLGALSALRNDLSSE